MKTPYIKQWLIVIRRAAWRKILPVSRIIETPQQAIIHHHGRAY